MSTFRSRLAIALLAGVLSQLPAYAIEPERREVIVAHNRVWDGFAYKENFVPSNQPIMTLLADKDNAIAMVRTQEYYWPLARQTYVAFESLREHVHGELIIERNGEEVTKLQSEPYSIVYPQGAINGLGYMVWGEDAELEFARYREEEATFNRRFARLRQAHTRYEAALREAARARIRGDVIPEIKPPPPLPQPSLKLVTQPQRSFRVALQPGNYDMYVRHQGMTVPDSNKKLRVLDSRSDQFLTADIIPEERWTRPLPSNNPNHRIYTIPGARFYITLSEASRFSEADYLQLTQPQAVAVKGRDIYVRRKSADIANLRISWLNGMTASTLELDQLKVQQTGGAAFGYVVRAAETDERPDIEAFTVVAPEGVPHGRADLSISGNQTLGFHREIVVVGEQNWALSVSLAILPAAFGLTASLRRRLRFSRNAVSARTKLSPNTNPEAQSAPGRTSRTVRHSNSRAEDQVRWDH